MGCCRWFSGTVPHCHTRGRGPSIQLAVFPIAAAVERYVSCARREAALEDRPIPTAEEAPATPHPEDSLRRGTVQKSSHAPHSPERSFLPLWTRRPLWMQSEGLVGSTASIAVLRDKERWLASLPSDAARMAAQLRNGILVHLWNDILVSLGSASRAKPWPWREVVAP